MDRFQYRNILEYKMLASAKHLFKDRFQNGSHDWIFMHDNDPKHTSLLVRKQLADWGIIVLDWPAQSPDLNPIENLLYQLNFTTKLRHIKTLDELMDTLQDAWNNALVPANLEALVCSMRARCNAVIAVKGLPTK